MSNSSDRTAILFVCMGNICRSPTAEGVFRKLVQDAGLADAVLIESAGTHAYHSNEPADRRAHEAALRRGFSLDGIRARRVRDDDFERFDLMLAMDRDNLDSLRERAPDSPRSAIELFLAYADAPESEVPDPYYGGAAGFERVLDLVEDASRGLLKRLLERQATGTDR
ncbi:MAG TPA: low molecular weight protein-tyrosine-phosphatase [Woeseiaceae bacterium]|nr:low molecular weight protein-tyrosine-phosphatase [Woeseiaceae bacterium]